MSSNTNPSAQRVHKGKTALITGSARSIGAAIARNLAAKGANICIIYLTEASDKAAKDLAEELSAAHGVKAVPCRADVTTKEGCDLIISTSQSSLPPNPKTGKLQVDILVHSAALFHTAPIEAVTPEDFYKVYTTNVLGPILLTQACKPFLPTDRSGRIVNVSSVGSQVGLQYLTLYGGTKGAIEAMTRTWARELAENCTVNSINPGSTMTDMLQHASDEVKQAIALFYPLTPLSGVREWDSDEMKKFGEKYGGRVAYPEEIAGIVGMICSPESSWMTGSLVSANGGQWMSS
ncbi:short-chain dehydrogenase [Pseudomassariella vexata]|uniref:Short-chain dehydrogenase n=1 Tax=Pseudomassariella vexata TaxID=1141098 RepID=A0A1Y2D8N8_9PEZI|nr:short-chain dehydrogenase [Pseudomassariella vexata]ORY55633.1 short-chain dehydrogenase [Pseudomassariella vexata]